MKAPCRQNLPNLQAQSASFAIGKKIASRLGRVLDAENAENG
jgi:hypothetical protein